MALPRVILRDKVEMQNLTLDLKLMFCDVSNTWRQYFM